MSYRQQTNIKTLHFNTSPYKQPKYYIFILLLHGDSAPINQGLKGASALMPNACYYVDSCKSYILEHSQIYDLTLYIMLRLIATANSAY